jgi:Fur family ferric uptake transcriptional regulator
MHGKAKIQSFCFLNVFDRFLRKTEYNFTFISYFRNKIINMSMADSKLTDLMEEHGIKVTANRLIVARSLHASLMPMSLAELERQILTLDKSSIFRVLNLFRDYHLVHVIEDGAGGVKYELCHSHSANADEDAHAHFHCEVCGRTLCLDHVPVPMIRLPEGYEAHSVNYLIKGVCPDCLCRK